MDRDRTTEVSVRIERGVLDWVIARPVVATQSKRLNDRWRETKIVIVP